jgi:hypothetical protein
VKATDNVCGRWLSIGAHCVVVEGEVREFEDVLKIAVGSELGPPDLAWLGYYDA